MGIYKRYCWVCWYGGRCWRLALSGSFASATNWGGIIGAGLLAFVFQRYGSKIMPAEGPYEIVAQGLLFIVAAWIVIFLFRLIFIAPFQVHREGQWRGPKLIYKEPKLACHAYLTPTDNNQPHKFRFLDAPPDAFIDFEIRFDTGAARDLTSICVACTPQQLPRFESHRDLSYTSGGILVNRRRDMCFTTFLREDADPFSIRIYVKSWTKPILTS
jgi:hypothetical protein